MTIKEELFHYCKGFALDRQARIKNKISDIEESLFLETKSSAGDKHETGRAMLQLEREKLGFQLKSTEELIYVLKKINFNSSSKIVCLGSIVITTENNYFISISAGEIKAKSKQFFTVAPNSPIGKLLLGKKEGDKIAFNYQKFTIKQIQ